jgi:hypothetical protein
MWLSCRSRLGSPDEDVQQWKIFIRPDILLCQSGEKYRRFQKDCPSFREAKNSFESSVINFPFRMQSAAAEEASKMPRKASNF